MEPQQKLKAVSFPGVSGPSERVLRDPADTVINRFDVLGIMFPELSEEARLRAANRSRSLRHAIHNAQRCTNPNYKTTRSFYKLLTEPEQCSTLLSRGIANVASELSQQVRPLYGDAGSTESSDSDSGDASPKVEKIVRMIEKRQRRLKLRRMNRDLEASSVLYIDEYSALNTPVIIDTYEWDREVLYSNWSNARYEDSTDRPGARDNDAGLHQDQPQRGASFKTESFASDQPATPNSRNDNTSFRFPEKTSKNNLPNKEKSSECNIESLSEEEQERRFFARHSVRMPVCLEPHLQWMPLPMYQHEGTGTVYNSDLTSWPAGSSGDEAVWFGNKNITSNNEKADAATGPNWPSQAIAEGPGLSGRGRLQNTRGFPVYAGRLVIPVKGVVLHPMTGKASVTLPRPFGRGPLDPAALRPGDASLIMGSCDNKADNGLQQLQNKAIAPLCYDEHYSTSTHRHVLGTNALVLQLPPRQQWHDARNYDLHLMKPFEGMYDHVLYASDVQEQLRQILYISMEKATELRDAYRRERAKLREEQKLLSDSDPMPPLASELDGALLRDTSAPNAPLPSLPHAAVVLLNGNGNVPRSGVSSLDGLWDLPCATPAAYLAQLKAIDVTAPLRHPYMLRPFIPMINQILKSLPLSFIPQFNPYALKLPLLGYGVIILTSPIRMEDCSISDIFVDFFNEMVLPRYLAEALEELEKQVRNLEKSERRRQKRINRAQTSKSMTEPKENNEPFTLRIEENSDEDFSNASSISKRSCLDVIEVSNGDIENLELVTVPSSDDEFTDVFRHYRRQRRAAHFRQLLLEKHDNERGSSSRRALGGSPTSPNKDNDCDGNESDISDTNDYLNKIAPSPASSALLKRTGRAHERQLIFKMARRNNSSLLNHINTLTIGSNQQASTSPKLLAKDPLKGYRVKHNNKATDSDEKEKSRHHRKIADKSDSESFFIDSENDQGGCGGSCFPGCKSKEKACGTNLLDPYYYKRNRRYKRLEDIEKKSKDSNPYASEYIDLQLTGANITLAPLRFTFFATNTAEQSFQLETYLSKTSANILLSPGKLRRHIKNYLEGRPEEDPDEEEQPLKGERSGVLHIRLSDINIKTKFNFALAMPVPWSMNCLDILDFDLKLGKLSLGITESGFGGAMLNCLIVALNPIIRNLLVDSIKSKAKGTHYI